MSAAMRAGAPRTLQDFMAQALAMEREAVARYSEFADSMEMNNNREVSALFRTMAGGNGMITVRGDHQAG